MSIALRRERYEVMIICSTVLLVLASMVRATMLCLSFYLDMSWCERFSDQCVNFDNETNFFDSKFSCLHPFALVSAEKKWQKRCE